MSSECYVLLEHAKSARNLIGACNCVLAAGDPNSFDKVRDRWLGLREILDCCVGMSRDGVHFEVIVHYKTKTLGCDGLSSDEE